MRKGGERQREEKKKKRKRKEKKRKEKKRKKGRERNTNKKKKSAKHWVRHPIQKENPQTNQNKIANTIWYKKEGGVEKKERKEKKGKEREKHANTWIYRFKKPGK